MSMPTTFMVSKERGPPSERCRPLSERNRPPSENVDRLQNVTGHMHCILYMTFIMIMLISGNFGTNNALYICSVVVTVILVITKDRVYRQGGVPLDSEM